MEDRNDETSQELSTANDNSSPVSKRLQRVITEEEKQRAVVYWKSGKYKKLNLATVQKSFRYVTSLSQLYKWDKQLQDSSTSTNSSRRSKYKQISSHVYENFLQACAKVHPVHDEDLRMWALEHSTLLQVADFTASPTWVRTFKNRYNIVS